MLGSRQATTTQITDVHRSTRAGSARAFRRKPVTDLSSQEDVLDGNALAGPLREIFAVDVTTAITTCTGCGMSGPVATLRLWPHAPGLVARCSRCEDVVLRL